MAFSDPIVGGEGDLVRDHIRSPDYIAGVQGWTINRDGSAEFNNVTIRFDLATGSIVVGPSTDPQVVLTTATGPDRGLIQFPTNDSDETSAAEISSSTLGLGSSQQLLMQLLSGDMDFNSDRSVVALRSSSVDGMISSAVVLGAGGGTFLTLDDDEIKLDGVDVNINNELRVSTDTADANYPIRVAAGKVATGTTATTLSKVSNTLVTNAQTTGAFLENGVAYRVNVQIQGNSSAGTGAAGTQGVIWRLWDGAVGGTLLGNPVETYNAAVGTLSGAEQFSFVFEHTGSTGSRTLNLSGLHFTGADTRVAIVNTRYSMIINRIGDPANINNL